MAPSPLSDLVAVLQDRYAIEREIGAGGMATVYLARDVRHNRAVALKVLKPELGAVLGVERFLAEIQVTANLQHPNLLPLFDSGEGNGSLFYVMPFVDGESLRARLDREKQLPVDEAVRITIALAGALDYAHRQGVIHRDLKPENILLHEGQPLIADFGIALAVSNAAGNRITQTGLSLGTPQYMSPEQAAGDRQIDGRTDIYSLGAVAYEMLTGEPPYLGSTAQAVIARILTERPRAARTIRRSIPVHVDAAIARALEKFPADRWSNARELAEALSGARVVATSSVESMTEVRTASPLARRATQIAPWAIAAAAFAFAVTRRPTRVDTSVARFSVALPNDARLDAPSLMALSPDGQTIVYRGVSPSTAMLFVRALSDLQPHAIAGTEGATDPFFSRDGEWIGFSANGRLMKVARRGGAPTVIAAFPSSATSCSWGADDIIVCGGRDLLKVPASGGELAVIEKNGNAHRAPRFLADGRTIVFSTSSTPPNPPSDPHLAFATADGKVSVSPVIGFAATEAPGRILVYSTLGGELMAAPFNASSNTIGSHPVALDVHPARYPGGHSGTWAVSSNGSLVLTGGEAPVQMVLVDRSGRDSAAIGESRAFHRSRVSPDGKRIAIEIAENGGDIWVYTIASRTLSRLTTTGGTGDPVWSPDGKRILYTFGGRRGRFIVSQAADGSGGIDTVVGGSTGPGSKYAVGFGPDGALIYDEIYTPTTAAVMSIRRGDSVGKVVVHSTGVTNLGTVSPDGRWVAYEESRDGNSQVFVTSYPREGGRVQVSSGAGGEPQWAHNGHELFYRTSTAMMSATVRTTGEFAVLDRKVLFQDSFLRQNTLLYDVMPDDQHFLMLKGDNTDRQLLVVMNWISEVRAALAK
jgi:eukaryotic-like serine/threonine-protein kinase